MSVKSAFTNADRKKTSYLLLTLACLFIAIAISLIEMPNEQLVQEQTHLAMRAIGDELLKSNNDLSTPVPPIQQSGAATLRLLIGRPIFIDPDNLVDLSLKYLNASISLSLVVSVLDAATEEVVYGFEINHLKEQDIPCLGRILPVSEYIIQTSFYDQARFRVDTNVPALSLASASVLFAFFGFSSMKGKKVQTTGKVLLFGNLQLDLEQSKVLHNEQNIQLTEKEAQILAILFKYNGKLVTRDYLIEEVWLKNGVITGRSLDMYISRLRKKLQEMPFIQIVNQHGKGYFLKVT